MTEPEIRQHAKNHEWMESCIIAISREIATFRGLFVNPNNGCYSDFDFDVDGETITAHYSEYYRGDTDYEDVTFPLSYLWTADYMALETVSWEAHLKAEREERERLANEAELQRQQMQEEHERELYTKLHEKYGAK